MIPYPPAYHAAPSPQCSKFANEIFLRPHWVSCDVNPMSRRLRVIVLLDTFSKILKVVQTRLSTTAHLKGLISVHQAGSLPGVSAEDAAARLMHEIDATHRTGQCATTGFFDIMGGFDNVSHPILLDRLTTLGTPSYLVSWAGSFLSNRSITLVYPGSPGLSIPVSVGVPQGSPVSPLFFVIYVAPPTSLMAYPFAYHMWMASL